MGGQGNIQPSEGRDIKNRHLHFRLHAREYLPTGVTILTTTALVGAATTTGVRLTGLTGLTGLTRGAAS